MRSYSSIAARRPSLGVRAGAEPARESLADVERDVAALDCCERLQVGVDGDELDALDLGLDHAVDGVDAGAADADDAQHGAVPERRATAGGSARRRRADRRAAARAHRLEDVLRDVGREGGAQALLRASARRRSGWPRPRRHARGAAGVFGAGSRRGCSARPAARRRLSSRRAARAPAWRRLRRRARGPSSSVLRNRAASGPSRMLARLPLAIAEDLLRELRGRSGQPCRPGRTSAPTCPSRAPRRSGPSCVIRDANTRSPKFSSRISIASLAWSVRRVDQRRQDALDLDVGVEVLADHRERVLELDQAPHRQILALHGDDHLVSRRQGVDRQQPEARRRVDADEVVVVRDRL